MESLFVLKGQLQRFYAVSYTHLYTGTYQAAALDRGSDIKGNQGKTAVSVGRRLSLIHIFIFIEIVLVIAGGMNRENRRTP